MPALNRRGIFLSTPTGGENSVPSLSLRLYEFPSLCSLTTRFASERGVPGIFVSLPEISTRHEIVRRHRQRRSVGLEEKEEEEEGFALLSLHLRETKIRRYFLTKWNESADFSGSLVRATSSRRISRPENDGSIVPGTWKGTSRSKYKENCWSASFSIGESKNCARLFERLVGRSIDRFGRK